MAAAVTRSPVEGVAVMPNRVVAAVAILCPAVAGVVTLCPAADEVVTLCPAADEAVTRCQAADEEVTRCQAADVAGTPCREVGVEVIRFPVVVGAARPSSIDCFASRSISSEPES